MRAPVELVRVVRVGVPRRFMAMRVRVACGKLARCVLVSMVDVVVVFVHV